ncbi:hypothetical protein KM427_17130 [Nocardioides sp. LMS-CY]|uniref:hypothetical protein n=1 Tax=Nocardioides sp. (strain LMS-CY) TaxID=2840457 RepID=UPI001C0036F7|nr:hypothetical protein [Nocardioides sp. LMS-CY]QWF20684.1 hypothetical protein KM427_17130 [Nocardioides sp. LMS-CY]
MTRRRLITSTVLAGVLVLTAASTSAPAAHPDPLDRDLDLVASANASAAEPAVTDDAFGSDVARWRSVKADVVATGSAACDGCDAAGTALQVLYVSRGGEARLDNTATAWTQGCGQCAATALSVQVVVLRGVPTIVPNNRALAATAACESCRATGVAYQVVVASRHADRLSREALAALRAWVAEQAAALRTPVPVAVPEPAEPSPAPTSPSASPSDDTTEPPAPVARRGRVKAERRAQRSADVALGTLEDLVAGDLGAVPVSADSDVELSR